MRCYWVGIRSYIIAMKRNPTLPKFLHPKKISTLERIGQNNDGGYIIDKVNISNQTSL